jgi:hypothetical protein
MAAYSKRSLVDKLGIKEGHRVVILGAPTDYAKTLGELPAGVVAGKKLQGEYDFLHFFSRSRRELEQKFPALKSCMPSNGMLWIPGPRLHSESQRI